MDIVISDHEERAEAKDVDSGLFDETLHNIFPGSVSVGEFISQQAAKLALYGFTKETVIPIVAQCRDELTQEFTDQIERHLGQSFQIGGLAGMVFAGRTAFGAAMHHSPNVEGRDRYVIFAGPHIGISAEGEIGKVERENRFELSSACGSLVAVIDEIKGGKINLQLDTEDLEQSFVKQTLLSELKFGQALSLEDLTKKAQEVTLKTVKNMMDEIADCTTSDYIIFSTILIHGPGGHHFVYLAGVAGVVDEKPIDTTSWYAPRDMPAQFAEELQRLFPGAVESSEFVANQVAKLAGNGFRKDNSITIIAQCRDELTRDFTEQIEAHLGQSFQIGGLAGMVFAGRTAFSAALHHAPNSEGRERYIIFAGPHIAISQNGEVGTVRRPNRMKPSGACGSLLGVLSEMDKGPVQLQLDVSDLEQSFVKTQLLSELSFSEEISLPLVTEKIAEIIFERCKKILAEIVDHSKANYIIFSTILIHGPDGSNYIQFRDLHGHDGEKKITLRSWKHVRGRRLSALISPTSSDSRSQQKSASYLSPDNTKEQTLGGMVKGFFQQ